ncbi:MAG: hypothetical protein FWG79_05425 [Bacteroidales bacterium]|nr:hypothetical protein [Bacteroidales bacterium]
MKKLIYTMTAVIAFSLVFISCDKDPKEENGIKKLPSKITWTLDDHTRTEWTFKYNERNQLTEFVETRMAYHDELDTSIWVTKIEYDANNRLSKWSIDGGYSEVNTVQYVGNNQMIITSDWPKTTHITINASGQITKYEDAEFIYTDGNLTQAYSLNYSYSNVPNVFRNATNPDWLLFLIGEFGSIFSPPSKNMLTKSGIYYDDDYFQEWAFSQYQTDSDGYALSCKVIETFAPSSNIIYTEESIMTFEYVSAK